MKTNNVIDHEVPTGSSCDALRVHVIATSADGTVAALRVASTLASKLRAQITLLAMEEVPWPRPMRESPLRTMTIQKRLGGLVKEAGILGREVSTDVCFCRNEWHRLRKLLAPCSLVVLGGRDHWWSRRERALANYLRDVGHHVIFAPVGKGA